MTLTEGEVIERGIFADVQLALFDVGGVLFQFKGGLEALSVKTGLPYAKCHEIWLANDDAICKGEVHPQKLWQAIKEESRYQGPDIDFVSFWVECFQPNLQVHAVIKKISKNHAVGLLTNIYPDVYGQAVNSGKIPNLPYAFVVQSCEVGLVKPEKQIYQLAQQKSGMDPEKILFIDDKQDFINPASELGWKTLLFNANEPSSSATYLANGFAI